MIFIDANILLALDNSRDVRYNDAHELWSEIESLKFGEYFTSDYVFNEVVGVTFRKRGKKDAERLGDQVLQSIFIVNVDDDILSNAWAMFKNSDLALNLVDCSNIAVLKAFGMRVIATFDKEFRKVNELEVLG